MLTLGQHVVSIEHPTAIGKVVRINDNGDATIEFTTPRTATLPFGHIIAEFWPLADQSELVAL